jgi:hypothetical protein
VSLFRRRRGREENASTGPAGKRADATAKTAVRHCTTRPGYSSIEISGAGKVNDLAAAAVAQIPGHGSREVQMEVLCGMS